MRNQKLIGILAIAIFALNLAIPFAYAQEGGEVEAADLHSWYTTVPGVLDSDTYVLYPYELKSLKVGFSKYGELIGIPPGQDMDVQANWVGLEYDGRDPFCPPTYISMKSWINGWYIDIQYIDPAFPIGSPKRDRHLWAFAMFGDGFRWGGDWVYATDPAGEPHGGRKTNGYCVTEDLKVLYDGPRRFVAQSVTHIYDKEGTETWPVVDVTITLIFEKVKKEVILFKDVKLRIPKNHLWGKLNVQFSNREEVDLGPEPTYDSYADFFEQEGETCYGKDWHMAEYLARDHIEYQTTTASTTYTLNPPGKLVKDFIKIWVDGVFQDPSSYVVDWDSKTVKFNAPPQGKEIKFLYKYIFKDDWHKYDIAQVISSDKKYVFWAAMWPPVSDYTVDGMLRYIAGPLIEIKEPDIIGSEPKQSPLVIGEWDFAMEHEKLFQFRCVEVKGVTDRHDAVDEEFGTPKIDREIRYQLEEVFNPWDLVKAVHKETKRWVQFFTGDGSWASKTLKYVPVVGRELGGWDEYCSFSEKVLLLPEYKLLVPLDVLEQMGFKWWPSFPYTYKLEGQTIIFLKDEDESKSTLGDLIEWKVPSGKVIKVLYSTLPELVECYMPPKTDTENEVTTSGGSISPTWLSDVWTDKLGVRHDYALWLEDVKYTNKTALIGNYTEIITFDPIILEGESDFKVYAGEVHYGNVTDLDEYKKEGVNWTVTIDLGAFVKSIGCSNDSKVTWPLDMETVHVKCLNHTLYVTAYITVTTYPNSTTTNSTKLRGYIETCYKEKLGGRYEWTIVGKDAATVDSVGAALVTAAFKNKQVEIGNAGEDMYDPMLANQIPWVMRKFGAGTAKTDYYYLDDTKRTALKDDWCKTWPVASSNMIGVGGPLANLLAYYGNDFTDAFYGISDFAHPDWKGKVIALPCWAKNTYSSNENKGYAVIATYKDLNGTVLFLIWGHWGRDTFYASKFFHEEIIYELQEANAFDHVTALILEIDYKDPEHPTFKIPEVLGTISEKAVGPKGGIHDP